jgi:NhaC family Na+:H+ antiporter
VPAFLIALVLFFILGVAGPELEETPGEAVELASLDQIYWITPLNLLPLVLLVILSIRKVPASLALMFSALFAGLLAPFLQYDVLSDFVDADGNPVVTSIRAVWLAMANGFTIDSGIPDTTACCHVAAWTACCSPCG